MTTLVSEVLAGVVSFARPLSSLYVKLMPVLVFFCVQLLVKQKDVKCFRGPHSKRNKETFKKKKKNDA